MNKEKAREYLENISGKEEIHIFTFHDFHCEGCGRIAGRLFIRWLDGNEKIELCGGCAILHDRIEKYGVTAGSFAAV